MAGSRLLSASAIRQNQLLMSSSFTFGVLADAMRQLLD